MQIKDSYVIKHVNGITLHLKDGLSDEIVDLCVAHAVDSIQIRIYQPWSATNINEIDKFIKSLSISDESTPLSVVSHFNHLLRLSIRGYHPDLPLDKISKLEELEIDNLKSLPDWILNLKHLKDLCFGDNCKGISLLRLDELTNLNHLYFNDKSFTDYASIGKLCHLQRLVLSRFKSKDLSFIDGCDSIESMYICFGNLESLNGLQGCTKLKEVDFASCSKLSDISSLSNAPSLEKVRIESCKSISSLVPLVNCPKLKEIRLVESTFIVDGKMRCILDNQSLSVYNYTFRKHYDMKWPEAKAILDARNKP